MEKAAVVAIAGLTVAGSLPAKAQTADGVRLERAWSTWSEPRSARIVTEGLRVSGSSEEVTIGRVSSSTCRSDKGCTGSSLIRLIPSGAFELAPDLAEGSLSFSAHGENVTTRWESQSPPGAELKEGGAQVTKDAVAEGASYGSSLEVESLKRARTIGGLIGTPLPEPPVDLPASFATAERLATTCWTPRRAERRFARLHNEERLGDGLSRLKLDPELSRVARLHTREMTVRNHLFHSSSLQLRRRVTGWTTLGENVGVGGTPASLMRAFMDSPLHEANVLLPAFRYVGIGTKRGEGRLWVTVIFEAVDNPSTTLRMPSCN